MCIDMTRADNTQTWLYVGLYISIQHWEHFIAVTPLINNFSPKSTDAYFPSIVNAPLVIHINDASIPTGWWLEPLWQILVTPYMEQ